MGPLRDYEYMKAMSSANANTSPWNWLFKRLLVKLTNRLADKPEP